MSGSLKEQYYNTFNQNYIYKCGLILIYAMCTVEQKDTELSIVINC